MATIQEHLNVKEDERRAQETKRSETRFNTAFWSIVGTAILTSAAFLFGGKKETPAPKEEAPIQFIPTEISETENSDPTSKIGSALRDISTRSRTRGK